MWIRNETDKQLQMKDNHTNQRSFLQTRQPSGLLTFFILVKLVTHFTMWTKQQIWRVSRRKFISSEWNHKRFWFVKKRLKCWWRKYRNGAHYFAVKCKHSKHSWKKLAETLNISTCKAQFCDRNGWINLTSSINSAKCDFYFDEQWANYNLIRSTAKEKQ